MNKYISKYIYTFLFIVKYVIELNMKQIYVLFNFTSLPCLNIILLIRNYNTFEFVLN